MQLRQFQQVFAESGRWVAEEMRDPAGPRGVDHNKLKHAVRHQRFSAVQLSQLPLWA